MKKNPLLIMVIIYLLGIMLLICFGMLFSSCSYPEKDVNYIMIDGDAVEVVYDEDDNQYLKQEILFYKIYTPVKVFDDEQEDTLKFYKAYGKSKIRDILPQRKNGSSLCNYTKKY